MLSRNPPLLEVLKHSANTFYLKRTRMCQAFIYTLLSLLKYCQELLVLLCYLAIVHLQPQKINTSGHTRSIIHAYRPLYTRIAQSSRLYLLM